MSPKKSSTQTSKQKQQVKQVVNVRVGDIKAKRKRVAKRASMPKLSEPAPALLRSAPPINVSLSTQSYMPSQPSYVNEYNTLLRQLAEERTARQRAAAPLAPNTSPLTINEQRNELLNKVERPTSLDPITQTFSKIYEQNVNKETYDDPTTNENMFVNSSRLAENIAPKLPATPFDNEDIINYAEQNETQQSSLAETTPKKKKKFIIEEEEETPLAEGTVGLAKPPSPKKPSKKEKLFEETNDLIKFYNSETNDSIALVKKSATNKQIKEQKDRITNLIQDRALKLKKKG
jgi:hypothetical protein